MTEEQQKALALGQDAKAFLENPVFDKVLTHLTGKYIRVLVAEPVGSLTAGSAHATLRALNDFKDAVKLLASEVAVHQSKQKQ